MVDIFVLLVCFVQTFQRLHPCELLYQTFWTIVFLQMKKFHGLFFFHLGFLADGIFYSMTNMIPTVGENLSLIIAYIWVGSGWTLR